MNVRNPWDLLSVAFMIGQHTKNIKIEEIISTYQNMSTHFEEKKHGIHMGLGNAYRNDWQFLKA
jgi:hypothetical protein